ncbi:MAG: ATP synthase F1 subunit epsilon [Candidatus Omnitrophota bacterium]
MKEFQLEIISRKGSLYKDRATMLQVKGIEGEFTILAGHAPLLTVLKEGQIRISPAIGEKQSLNIEGGFIEVHKDQVLILTK